MLKFTNTERTCATFNGTSFCLASAEDWDSIGDIPTQEAVKAWLAAGNTPDPYVPPPPGIPQEVTRRQARQALLLAGLLSQVQPAIDAIADPTQRGLMQIEWEDSQTFQRSRPALISLATTLGLSGAQLDALFIKAATL